MHNNEVGYEINTAVTKPSESIGPNCRDKHLSEQELARQAEENGVMHQPY